MMTSSDPKHIFDGPLTLAAALVLLLELTAGLLLRAQYPDVHRDLATFGVAGLIFLLAAAFVIKKKIAREGFSLTGFEMPVGLLMAAACLGSLGSVYFSGSLMAVLVLASNLVFFYILVDILKNEEAQKTFGFLAVLAILVVAIFAVWEFFLPSSSRLHGVDQDLPVELPYKRVSSLFDTPNMLAAFCMLLLPGFWAMTVLAKRQAPRTIFMILIVLTSAVFLMTLSFLCTVNFLIVTIVLAPWIVQETTQRSISKKVFVGLSIGLLIVAAGIMVLRQDLSLVSRMEYLKTAWIIIKNHPWAGSGLDSFKLLSPQYLQSQSYSGYVHNSYLQLWVETGILGVIASLWLAISFVQKAFVSLQQQAERRQRILCLASVWTVGAFFLDNVTNFTFLSPDFSLFGWAALAAFCAFSIRMQKKQVAGHGLVLVAVALLLVLTVRMALSLVHEQNALKKLEEKDFVSAHELLQKAQGLNPGNQGFYVIQSQVDLQVYLLTKDRKFLDKAQAKLEEAVRLSPYSYMNYVLLYRIAAQQKDHSRAEKYLRQVAHFCPQKYKLLQEERR